MGTHRRTESRTKKTPASARNPSLPATTRGRHTDFTRAVWAHCNAVFAWKQNMRERCSNDRYRYRVNYQGGGYEFLRVDGPRLRDLNRVERGEEGFKVCNRLGGIALLYIDPDAISGDPQSLTDCRRMMEIVRRDFPQITEDPIYNERGGAAWLRVDTEGMDAHEFNALVDRLEQHYRSVARALGLRLKVMEVHGKVYEHHWTTDDRGRKILSSITLAGDMLKCPPSIQWLQQPVVQASYLNDPKFAPVADLRLAPLASDAAPSQSLGSHRVNPTGSWSGKLVSEQMQARLGMLESRLRNWFSDRPRRSTSGDRHISSRAFAELVLAMTLLRPNGDGTNPQRRFEFFVQTLYEEGVFRYAWNPNVWHTVKEHLGQKGLICWTDRTYFVGTRKKERTGRLRLDGKPRKNDEQKDGVATKWSVDQQLVERVLGVVAPKEQHQEEQALPPDLVYPPLTGPHEHQRPLRVTTDPRHLDWYSGGPPDWYEGLRDRRMADFALAV